MFQYIIKRHGFVAFIIVLTLVLVTIGTVQSGAFTNSSNPPVRPRDSLSIVPTPYLSYYDILNVSMNATDSQLKRAYRKQVAKWHADKVQRLGMDKQMEARANFDRATQAYEFLTSHQRCQYDRVAMGATTFQNFQCRKRLKQRKEKERQAREEEIAIAKAAKAEAARTKRANKKTGKTKIGLQVKRGAGRELVVYAVGSLIHFVFEKHENFFNGVFEFFCHWALLRLLLG
ncbi:hypothetical protein FHL15_000185 [Xylaria flabelliformis]|uniref:J domain-containing protein n=1 Tax=Xylaria flabelliformis TaxID=2512241 RepID=A0A553IF65_9PEZI|nr:hypothetical protein FHL15_000185 [Xylaria flabelliformis]